MTWQPMETAPKDGTWIAALYTNNLFYEPIRVRWNPEDADYPWQARDNEYPEGRLVGWVALPALDTKSAPQRPDAHNSGEVDPSVMPDSGGADTALSSTERAPSENAEEGQS